MMVVSYITSEWLLILCHSRRKNKAGREWVDAKGEDIFGPGSKQCGNTKNCSDTVEKHHCRNLGDP
jgi:hypothetical protein